MNVLSLFDGMSCGRIALDRADITVSNYFSSEIKPHAIKVANKNYPQDMQNRLGDVTKLRGKSLPSIDLLIGGSPCQDFSQANKERTGVEGTKSSLFFEYLRILDEVKPRYFLLENVRMKKEHQDFVSDLLGCEPIVFNSSLVSPQLRHRLYWTNIHVTQAPQDKHVSLNSILVDGYSDREKARALLESDSRPLTTPLKMVHRYMNTGFTTLIFKNEDHFHQVSDHFHKYFKGLAAKEIDIASKNIDLSVYNGVRYMTQEERELCQTVPRGYTSCLNQNDASCVLGDGWTVDIIAHIFRFMK